MEIFNSTTSLEIVELEYACKKNCFRDGPNSRFVNFFILFNVDLVIALRLAQEYKKIFHMIYSRQIHSL